MDGVYLEFFPVSYQKIFRVIWGELHGCKLLVPISLCFVVKLFDLTVGPVVVGLVISIITSLKHKYMDVYYPHNCYGTIIKLSVVYVIKEYLIVEVLGSIYLGKDIHHHKPAIYVYIKR